MPLRLWIDITSGDMDYKRCSKWHYRNFSQSLRSDGGGGEEIPSWMSVNKSCLSLALSAATAVRTSMPEMAIGDMKVFLLLRLMEPPWINLTSGDMDYKRCDKWH